MNANPHLWEYRWVRDLMLLVVVALLLAAAYAARAIVAPVLIGLVLAYVFNPVVTVGQVRLKVPRWTTTLALMGAGVVAVLVLMVSFYPTLRDQAMSLYKAMGVYAHTIARYLAQYLNIDWEQAKRFAAESMGPGPDAAALPEAGALPEAAALPDAVALPEAGVPQIDFQSIGALIMRVLGYGVDLINSTINLSLYLTLVVVVVAICFFYFSWKFDQVLGWFAGFIPKAGEQQTLEVLRRMDRTVSAFVRGRMIQAAVMGTLLSVGWSITGVPYWLLLGLGAGMLNLVPLAAIVGWLAAVLLALVDHLSNLDAAAGEPALSAFSVWVIVWPSVVYMIAQAVDNWIVEPIVQGKATDLDPLTVLLAVLIGGALAGLVGLIVAVPVAACVKILSQQVILPHLRAVLRGTPG